MLHSKLWCGCGRARGHAAAEGSAGIFEEPDLAVYKGSPSSRAKEMFSKNNKNTVYPQKHIWECLKEQSFDDRRLLETRSDVSLQLAAAMNRQVGF